MDRCQGFGTRVLIVAARVRVADASEVVSLAPYLVPFAAAGVRRHSTVWVIVFPSFDLPVTTSVMVLPSAEVVTRDSNVGPSLPLSPRRISTPLSCLKLSFPISFPSGPFTDCIVPSCGPLHEYDIAVPLASTTSTRHESNCGVSFMIVSVSDFGTSSPPNLLSFRSAFHVPTVET